MSDPRTQRTGRADLHIHTLASDGVSDVRTILRHAVEHGIDTIAITYHARGYPPSDVPDAPDAYSQDQDVDDLHALLGHLGVEQA